MRKHCIRCGGPSPYEWCDSCMDDLFPDTRHLRYRRRLGKYMVWVCLVTASVAMFAVAVARQL